MDAHPPRHEDDLSDLERRLAGWRPSAEGLEPTAPIFAAGRDTGRRGRPLTLALCGLLAAVAVALGAWGVSERAGRLALAERLRERAPTPSACPESTLPPAPGPAYEPSPGDYLSLRRSMEQDPSGWLASLRPAGTQPPGPPPPAPAVLTPRQRDALFDQ